MLETIRLLYDYTKWADGRMFEAAGKLAPEQWTKDLGSSLKSTRDTVVHLVSAQWIWLSRWTGESPKAMLAATDYPTQASIREKWESLAGQLAGSVVSVELRPAQHPRPAGQARGSRRSPALRRARILDAGVARSESDFRT